MKCPLSPWHNKELIGTDQVTTHDCLKEECAWWDTVLSQCVILSLGDWLENLHSALSGMFDKMPHKGQFRK